MFYKTESNSQKNDGNQTNFTKSKPSILDCKRFIRERCAAGYLSRDSIQIPIPSGKDDTEKCGICGKTMAELEEMMEGVYGNDWKKQLKAQYSDTYKTILADYQRNAIMGAKKNEQLDFQKKFDEFCSSGMKGQMIANNDKKDLKHEIKIFITEPNQVRLVSTPDRHFAVLANENIPAFTKFGPFEGEITDNIRKSSDSYWIFTGDNNNEEIKIDGQSCIKSNWMSRIRKNKKEANCVAYVSGDSIHYVALVNIIKNQEIIVHPDIFRSNKNNGSDNKPGDGQDKPDDESSKSGSLDDDKSDGDDGGDDGGDGNDGGKKNDDDESSSSDDDDGNGAPDDQTEDDDQITGAGSEATSDQREVQRPQAENYDRVLAFNDQYIEKEEVADELRDLYRTINSEDVYNKMMEYVRLQWGNYRFEPDWVTLFRSHFSEQARTVFREELKQRDPDKADLDPKLNTVIAVSHPGQQLKIKDLYSLWTESPNSFIHFDCFRYYTNIQIEILGLENLCCALPFEVGHDIGSFSNKSQKELLDDVLFGRRVKKMLTSDFVIGGFLYKEHWMSVFANRNEEGIIHLTDSFGPSERYLSYKKLNLVKDEKDDGTINMKNKETDQLQKTFLVLQQLFNTMGWGVREIVTDRMARDQQPDGFNCGVYAAEYNEQILRQIKRHQDNLAQFQLPQRLSIDHNAMLSGVYRWKIAETMLLPSLKRPKSYCGKHIIMRVDDNNYSNIFSLSNGNSPTKLMMIELEIDANVVKCDNCGTLYHFDCVIDDNSELGDCYCGAELKFDSLTAYKGIEIDKEAPISLTPVKEENVDSPRKKTPGSASRRDRTKSSENIGSASKKQKIDQESSPSTIKKNDVSKKTGSKKTPESTTPQRKTPKSNTQVGDNNAVPTPKKRRMSNSSQQVGSAGKKQKTDEKPSSSSKKTPKTGSPKSPEPKKKSDQVGRKSKNAKKKLIFENNEQKK